MRFDPVWRRIKPDSFTDKLEGTFPDRLKRLDGLNNWGALTWLYPHASASKLAHHYGLERNAMQFLDGHADREKYRASFRVAAHVLHWGHLPLSYSGAEAVLRAAHVDAGVANIVSSVVDEVIAAGKLSCDTNDHECVKAIRSGDGYTTLYRWLSTWLVMRDWKRVWKAICAASAEELISRRSGKATRLAQMPRASGHWSVLHATTWTRGSFIRRTHCSSTRLQLGLSPAGLSPTS